jgi:hypothetical protein
VRVWLSMRYFPGRRRFVRFAGGCRRGQGGRHQAVERQEQIGDS